MMAKFGFIGTGNMGGALARALAKTTAGSEIALANRTAAQAEALAKDLGCSAGDNASVAARAEYLFLGVKPQGMEALLAELRPVLEARAGTCCLVSMAAGLTIETLRRMAGVDCPIIRIMPNTPAAVGQGMILYSVGPGVTTAQEQTLVEALSAAGRLTALPESLIDAGSAVAGCGPAFVDLFVEGLADGGVACGLPRAQAMELAAQMVLGSAALILASGQHPGVLKDQVCSPGGSTIQGVRALEERGFRSSCMEAVIAAFEKTRALGG